VAISSISLRLAHALVMVLRPRSSSATGVLAAACAVQLLRNGVRTASAETLPGKPMSQDYLTLRYHGRDSDRFDSVVNFPADVCSTAPATCMDIRLWECVDSPLDMRVPYNYEAQLGTVPVDKSYKYSRENAGGSRLLLARSGLSPRSPMDSDPQLVLWSGCNASCTDCAAGTGKLMIVQQLPKCVQTSAGGVFGILYNGNTGQRNTHQNCWASLDTYDREAERQSKMRLIVKYCAFGSVALVGCALATLLICYRCHVKRRRAERQRALAEGTGGASPPPVTIGKATVEKHFPVSHSDEGNQCVVCLLNIEEADACRKLQCGHEFHSDCIMGWWMHVPRASLECPLCKSKQSLGEDDPEEAPEAAEAPAASNNDGAQEQAEAGTNASETPAEAPAASGTAADDLEAGRNRPNVVVVEPQSI